MAHDPFTLEIVSEALRAVVEEMFVVQGRTSKSPIIYEVLDYACGLTDPAAQLVAQANGVTGFSGALTFPVRDVLAKFGTEGVAPGDVIVNNIPYGGGGSHLSDVTMTLPVFVGDRVLGFVVNKAHWTEVGGKDPGSMTNDATEIYQEGLQLPCVKLFVRGTAEAALVDMIAANVRTPEETLGDLFAQAAALRVGEARIRELAGRYGGATVVAAIAEMLDAGERLARAELAALPAGTYEAEDELEPDGFSQAVPVRVRVTITPDAFVADFTGTGPTVRGTVNCSRISLHAGMRMMFQAIACPRFPPNEGCFRPLQVVCPDDTVFTARHPTPTSTYWESRLVATDLVWRALAPVVPHRLPAGHFLSVCSEVLRTENPRTGDMALVVEPNAGGWGAGEGQDGQDGLFCVGDGETYVLSTEVAETRYAVRVEEFAFDPRPGGEGRWRGGRGVVRAYRLLAHEGSITASFGRSLRGAWGVHGGRDGTPNYVEVVFADGRPPLRGGKPTRVPLRRGDLVRLVTGTGGGWGAPRLRERAALLADLRGGMVDAESARAVYGLEI